MRTTKGDVERSKDRERTIVRPKRSLAQEELDVSVLREVVGGRSTRWSRRGMYPRIASVLDPSTAKRPGAYLDWWCVVMHTVWHRLGGADGWGRIRRSMSE
jgi:hypothetical protein